MSARNLLNIFNQSVATILAAGGMLFLTAMAGTDISTGVVVALAGMYGLMAAQTTGNSVGLSLFLVKGLLLDFYSGL